MSREAVIVANTAVAQDIQRSVSFSVLRRTIEHFANLLRSLKGERAFNVKCLVDEPPQHTKTQIETASRRASDSNALLMFYYFGHGDLTPEYELQLIYSSRKKSEDKGLKITTLETIIADHDLQKSLMIIDCCYAGAVQRSFQSILKKGQHCRLSSTTPTTRARLRASSVEPPIGTFTQAILDGFATTEACVSATDNSVTAESLFRYADRITRSLTKDIQQPQMYGRLDEVLFEYIPKPQIIEGYSDNAGDKTAYAKIYAICSTLFETKGCRSISELYDAVLSKHRHKFLTPYRLPDGSIDYQPAKPDTIYKYIRFLRSLNMVEDERLRLTSSGLLLIRTSRTKYNLLLIEAIDKYLNQHGLNRDRVECTLRNILSFRGVPSRGEVFDRLIREGHRLPTTNLGILLDILGYAGAIRMTTDRAYFPY